MATDIQWIKLSTDVFNNRKIKAIEDMPDGDALLVIWFKLLVLAGETNDNGLVYFTKDIPFTEQLLASHFKKSLSTIQLALTTFERFGMIDVVNDIICVSNWEKYQNVDGMDRVREQTRKRVTEYRQRQKLLSLGDDVTLPVTLRNGADKEEDKEKDKEKETNKEKDDLELLNSMSGGNEKTKKPPTYKRELEAVLDDFGIKGELREAFVEFIAMREKKHRPLTQRAMRGVVNKLNKISTNYDEQLKILDQSLEHSWDTVYELYKDNKTGKNGIKISATEDHTLDGIL